MTLLGLYWETYVRCHTQLKLWVWTEKRMYAYDALGYSGTSYSVHVCTYVSTLMMLIREPLKNTCQLSELRNVCTFMTLLPSVRFLLVFLSVHTYLSLWSCCTLLMLWVWTDKRMYAYDALGYCETTYSVHVRTYVSTLMMLNQEPFPTMTNTCWSELRNVCTFMMLLPNVWD